MKASPVGFQSQIFEGLVSQVQVLNIGVPDVGFKAFAPQGEAWGFEIPPNCGFVSQGWSLWQNRVSASPTCFDVGFFLFT